MSAMKSPEEMTIGQLRLAIWDNERQQSWLKAKVRDLKRLLEKVEKTESRCHDAIK